MTDYYAVSGIKYSDAKDEGNEVVYFEAGQLVEGLPVEAMKQLWEVGALTKEAPVAEHEEAPVDETATTDETAEAPADAGDSAVDTGDAADAGDAGAEGDAAPAADAGDETVE